MGNDLTYDLTVSNGGPAAPAEVVVLDRLRGGVVFVSASASKGTCSKRMRRVLCKLGVIAPEASVAIRISVVPTRPGRIRNTARVTTSDADSENNDVMQTTTVIGHACTNIGTRGPDVLLGGSEADVICGLAGADRIRGLPGWDRIYGGSGNDVIRGSTGNDDIRAGKGADVVLGAEGDDKLVTRDLASGNDSAYGGSGTDECATDPGDRRVSCP